MVGVNDKAQENCIQNRLNASKNLATYNVGSATEESCHLAHLVLQNIYLDKLNSIRNLKENLIAQSMLPDVHTMRKHYYLLGYFFLFCFGNGGQLLRGKRCFDS